MPLELADLNLDRATRLWSELNDPRIAGPLEYPVTLRAEHEGGNTWWYVDRTLTVQPARPGVLGDLVHNYRSCLDHAVATIRRAEGLGDSLSSSWPMYPNNSKGRATADRALEGLPQAAKDVVNDHQVWGSSDFGETLEKLGELDNANKHRQLVTAIMSPRTLGTVNLPIAEVAWHRVRIEKDALLVEHPRQTATSPPCVTAEVAIDEPNISAGHLHVADLVWQLDFVVRTAVAALLRAYDPGATVPFTGPTGPSGYAQGRVVTWSRCSRPLLPPLSMTRTHVATSRMGEVPIAGSNELPSS